MNKQGYVDLIINRPACTTWDASATVKKKAIEGALDVALSKVLTAHDWPFVMSEASATTFASVSDYTLKGNDSDCRDVAFIRYGDSNILLARKTLRRHYDYQSGQETAASSVGYWIHVGEKNGFPLIRLVGTPAAGQTIKYAYRMKNLKIDSFPDNWAGVLVADVEAQLFGSVGASAGKGITRTADPTLFKREAERALLSMIDDYSRRGEDDADIPIDSRWRGKNRRRNALYGF